MNQSPDILLVDDDDDLRGLVAAQLQDWGYSTLEVDSGEAAIALAINRQPRLVLLDITMPGINGVETCAQLKEAAGWAEVPIIMLTSRNDGEAIAASFAAGASDFLVKPVNWQLLQQRVKLALHDLELRRQLLAKEAELTAAQRAARLGTIRIEVADKRITLSKSCCELLEIPHKHANCQLADFLQRVHPDDRAHVEFTLERAIREHSAYVLEYRYTGAVGRELILLQQGELVYPSQAEGNAYLVGSLQDVTESRNAQDELDYQRLYDPLTSLPNRRFFETQVRHLLAHPPQNSLFGVIFVGLDHFTRVNDSLGHSGGDFALREIAERLNEYETYGHVVARFGGDVFALAIKNIRHINECDQALQSILAMVREPITVAGHEVFLTASAGVSLFPLESEKAVELLHGAEAAMMRSRAAGGDRYTYRTVEMNKETRRRTRVLAEMRTGLKRNQFVTYYQPQIDSNTLSIMGMEALVRWHHPERGLIGPSEFIELAEDSGLIIAIGAQVLRTACEHTKRWLDMGFELRLGVNLSPKQFDQDDLCDSIFTILDETSLPPVALEVEITESMALKNHEATQHKLERLRSIGIKASMDDFGTGFSSLSQLQQLPLDTLKVDQSFIRCISRLPGPQRRWENAAIADAVIAMAHSMGLEVIAEGVETEAQLRFLTRQGSDILQGFLFSKPLPADEFEKLLFTQRDLEHPWIKNGG